MSFPNKILYVRLILHQVAGLQSSLEEDFIFKATVSVVRTSVSITQEEAILSTCPLNPPKHLKPPSDDFLQSCFSGFTQKE